MPRLTLSEIEGLGGAFLSTPRRVPNSFSSFERVEYWSGKEEGIRMVRLQVELNIHEGELEAFEALAQQMSAVSQQEAGTLVYQFCLSADRTRCRLIEAYIDTNALEAHFAGPAVREFVPKLMEHSSVSRFEVYGDPGPQVAAMVAGFGAEIFTLWHGFSR